MFFNTAKLHANVSTNFLRRFMVIKGAGVWSFAAIWTIPSLWFGVSEQIS